ncbi:hypothetical protein A8C56_12335 [Niabella ginsenosidivorans]|uniref:Uncharacterized protein n=1 Tax=Niabella ginsenosidivorans TaxID=1176587 RepID=A0A1A9I535_9BACT|nr:hypothetical protein A8C56_12335 [Niabella ginsenosidivorans]
MEKVISIVADICGIIGFVISLFVVSTVYKIKKQISNSNNNSVSVSGTNVGGDLTGRDKKIN